TNNHVYQQYIDDLANFPHVEAQFNGNTIKPETRLIDGNKELDLATLDVPAIFVSPVRGTCCTTSRWGGPHPSSGPRTSCCMVVIPANLRRFRQGKSSFRSNRSSGAPPISPTPTSSCTL